jgi:CBS domain-containing protein/ribosome-associated translation inhibitor RaiA
MPPEWPRASEMMSGKPITVETSTPLSSVVGLMRAKGIHEVPVLEDGRLVGLVLYEALARRHSLSMSSKVEHVMVVPPTFPPRATFPEVAERLLETGRRAGCVVDPKGGRLLGIVSRSDLTRVAVTLPSLAGQPVLPAAQPPPRVLRDTESALNLISELRTLEEFALPVVDAKNKLVGTVALKDLAEAFWRTSTPGKRDRGTREQPPNPPVSSVMSSPAITVPSDATVGEACRRMTVNALSSVLVEEHGRALGIFSQGDLLRLAVRARPREQVFVEITGFSPGSDPRLLSELDQSLARGLKRLGRLTEPRTLSVHVVPQDQRRTGQATVTLRMHTDRETFAAERTDWSVLTAAARALEDVAEQVRKRKEERVGGKRLSSLKDLPADAVELSGQADLEERLSRSLPPSPGRKRR